MHEASVDFETRSLLNLNEVGVHKYVEHPSTRIMCMAWRIGTGKISVWRPGLPFPRELRAHIASGGLMNAWNAMFERIVWSAKAPLDWPKVKMRQWRCTMVRALAVGFPGALEMAAIAMKLTSRKDMAGNRAMQQLSKPRTPRKKIAEGAPIVWWTPETAPDKYRAMYSYCADDVATESEAASKLPHLNAQEQELYYFDQRINDRGVFLDPVLCRAAIKVVAVLQTQLIKECMQITGGVKPSAVAKLKEWLRSVGYPVESFDRDKLRELMKGNMPSRVRRVLNIRLQAGKSSTAKFAKALAARCNDGRIHGMLQFNGASTGRWAGRLVQLQNLLRPILGDKKRGWGNADVVELVRLGLPELLELVFDRPMQAVADSQRGMLTASPDCDMYAADLKNIESRGLAYLSGQQSVLDAWHKSDIGKGPDLYVLRAASMFDVAPERVDSELRFWGKQAELALGYNGGVGAFTRLAEKAGGTNIAALFPTLHANADERTRWRVASAYKEIGEGDSKAWRAAQYIVLAWRKDNPYSVRWWKLLEHASIAAVEHPGTVHEARSVLFKYDKATKMLRCRLPSGRYLYYAEPSVKTELTKWGTMRKSLRAYYVNETTRQWWRFSPYGGFLAENVTQAFSRDILAHGMVNVEKHLWRVLFTVHDEVISERAKTAIHAPLLDTYIKYLTATPPWVTSFLPLAAEGWVGQRYTK